MSSFEIVELNEAHYDKCASLHFELLKEGYLYLLGISFLKGLYKRLLTSKDVYGYVAKVNGEVVGVIVITKNVNNLIRRHVLKDPIFFSFHIVKFVILNFKYARQFIQYSRYGKDIPGLYHDILFFGAVGSYGGVGSQLLQKVVQNNPHVLTVTTTVNNSKAIHVYQKYGFKADKKIKFHKMDCLRLIRYPDNK
ncbi:MAG: hypothetical protein ABR954_06505 [Dehalococcoidales bacterium]